MVQLANLAAGRNRPQAGDIPPEPILPAFHKLSRSDLILMSDKVLEAQERAVFTAFLSLVANRSASSSDLLGELRGSLAREIRGLQSLRDEFEGPLSSEDEPAKVDTTPNEELPEPEVETDG